ncbi:serine/threonine-protein phosphatase PGAM5, mitochondrial-like isoform X2 [Crassostrea virginica]|uniref:Serine/threonine-protein phosphatase PGAM5, mitochondrial n=1 Tax=Crassostrea virginica TaxID=6565 RepID=A0A8B8EC31_CRAVI|nr:serine/threonine-protein phosphatase PGAM5, mitochondrial-like isoform X2 [Crassostrea virginica]
MVQYKRMLMLTKGICAAVTTGTLGYALYTYEGKVVHASWTTNFEPSVKWNHNWDRRDPESLVKPIKGDPTEKESKDRANKLDKQKSTATRHLLLIRHGQYNLEGKEDSDRYLTKLGRKQADYCGKRLKEADFAYTRLVSSTMTRAVETAEIIHKHLPHLTWEKEPNLCEGAPIPPEPPVGNWKPEQWFFQDGPRIETAFRKLFHRAEPEQTKDSYEVVVCHANVIRYFICRALQFPPEAWLRIGLDHASITWITIRPNGRVSVRRVGDSGFIPVGEVTVS